MGVAYFFDTHEHEGRKEVTEYCGFMRGVSECENGRVLRKLTAQRCFGDAKIFIRIINYKNRYCKIK